MTTKKKKNRLRNFFFLSLIFAGMLLAAVLLFEVLGTTLAPVTSPPTTTPSTVSLTPSPTPKAKKVKTFLLYVLDETSKEIESLYLEVRNKKQNTLHFIQIPANSRLSLSTELYQQLSAGNPSVPQLIQLSQLYHYYNSKQAFSAGVTILSKMLNQDISDYKTFTLASFSEYTSKKTLTPTYHELKGKLVNSGFQIEEGKARKLLYRLIYTDNQSKEE